MSFDHIRLPDDIERGAQGGPKFNTTVLELTSGAEKRNQNWSLARAEYDIGYGMQKKTDFAQVLAFFYARRGKARGFLFKDWSDFEVDVQLIAVGDGTTSDFQLLKTYNDGSSSSYVRPIYKPVLGTIQLFVGGNLKTEGVEYSVNYETGIVHLFGAPTVGQTIEWAGEFDVPVRFDTDRLDLDVEHYDAASISGIPLVELRLEE